MVDHSGRRIAVDVGYVEELEGRCRRISSELSGLVYSAEVFKRAPEVKRALDGFQGRWDGNRADICEGLDALAEALKTIRDSFVELDASLAVSLEQEGDE